MVASKKADFFWTQIFFGTISSLDSTLRFPRQQTPDLSERQTNPGRARCAQHASRGVDTCCRCHAAEEAVHSNKGNTGAVCLCPAIKLKAFRLHCCCLHASAQRDKRTLRNKEIKAKDDFMNCIIIEKAGGGVQDPPPPHSPVSNQQPGQ